MLSYSIPGTTANKAKIAKLGESSLSFFHSLDSNVKVNQADRLQGSQHPGKPWNLF